MTRHRFDPISFVFGVLFTTIAVAGLVGVGRIRPVDVAWVGPGLLILLGLIVLLTSSGRTVLDEHEAEADAGGSTSDGAPAGGDPRG